MEVEFVGLVAVALQKRGVRAGNTVEFLTMPISASPAPCPAPSFGSSFTVEQAPELPGREGFPGRACPLSCILPPILQIQLLSAMLFSVTSASSLFQSRPSSEITSQVHLVAQAAHTPGRAEPSRPSCIPGLWAVLVPQTNAAPESESHSCRMEGAAGKGRDAFA